MYNRNEILLIAAAGLCSISTTIAIAATAVLGGEFALAVVPAIAVVSAVVLGYLLGVRREARERDRGVMDQIAELRAATQQHIDIHRAMRFQPEDLHTQIANIQSGIASIQRVLALVLARAFPSERDTVRKELGG